MAGVTAEITHEGSLVAAKMAVKEVGGAVLGKPVQVISPDHQHKVDVGSAIAQRWIDVEGVDAIVDVPNSGVALAIHCVREKADRALFRRGNDRADERAVLALRLPLDLRHLCGLARTASAVVKAGGTSWFILGSDYAFGHQLQPDTTAVLEAAGGKVLGAVRHQLNAPDFSSFLLQVQASGAKVIGIANAGNDTVNAMKQAGEFGLVKGGQSLAALILFLQDVHALGLAAAQGTYLTTASYWYMNDQTRAWSKEFMAKTGMMPSMLQAGRLRCGATLSQSRRKGRHRRHRQGPGRHAIRANGQERCGPQWGSKRLRRTRRRSRGQIDFFQQFVVNA